LIEAVVFDLDGLLLDTEQVWDEVREGITRERGGRWHERAQADMMGMSSTEWSRYMHDVLGLSEPPEQLNRLVVERMQGRYRERLPVIDGAVEAVRRIGARWPLGLASSSNRPLIDAALSGMGIGELFRATVSSEEVERGKPAPDVYLETAHRLGVEPANAVAIEDSGSGIGSARDAGMRVVAIPNPHFPPPEDVLADADLVLDGLAELTTDAVESASSRREP
jgi:HAD superfamily hydrolase (TIGR01509 family)